MSDERGGKSVTFLLFVSVTLTVKGVWYHQKQLCDNNLTKIELFLAAGTHALWDL